MLCACRVVGFITRHDKVTIASPLFVFNPICLWSALADEVLQLKRVAVAIGIAVEVLLQLNHV